MHAKKKTCHATLDQMDLVTTHAFLFQYCSPVSARCYLIWFLLSLAGRRNAGKKRTESYASCCENFESC